jgi:hypothetical protein
LGEHQLDKLGVTGSSPVPPTHKRPAQAGLLLSSWTTRCDSDPVQTPWLMRSISGWPPIMSSCWPLYAASMTASDYEAGREKLGLIRAWWDEEGESTRNEATTRLHLIDELLIGVLGWPKNQVVAEESHGGAFADYSLGRPATRLIVEAKREGTYFELPVGVGPGSVSLKTLFETSTEIEAAIRQVRTYCQDRGVPLAAVCNGHQVIAFLASRQAAPPLSGRALVFDSLVAMEAEFPLMWNNLSRFGVEALTIHRTLGDSEVATPPAKLAARIPDYPGYWRRNRIQTELKILGDLVLQDIATAPELEDDFLRECYSTSNTLSEYALVSKEILEARYSALTSVESEADLAAARTPSGLSGELTTDLVAASLGRRPLILLGDVGVGKSMFIRHFVKIDAREVMSRSIVLTINFGGEPAFADDLNDFVMDRFVEQLREYDVDVEADKFVRNVYKSELKSFEEGVHKKLRKSNPSEFDLKEIQLLEKKLSTRDRHLQASLRFASRTMKRQIVVFLDNIDQQRRSREPCLEPRRRPCRPPRAAGSPSYGRGRVGTVQSRLSPGLTGLVPPVSAKRALRPVRSRRPFARSMWPGEVARRRDLSWPRRLPRIRSSRGVGCVRARKAVRTPPPVLYRAGR